MIILGKEVCSFREEGTNTRYTLMDDKRVIGHYNGRGTSIKSCTFIVTTDIDTFMNEWKDNFNYTEFGYVPAWYVALS